MSGALLRRIVAASDRMVTYESLRLGTTPDRRVLASGSDGMRAARTAGWILWAAGLGVSFFGLLKAFQGFRLMLESKPTGASLTFAFGVVLIVTGLAIFSAGFLFRGKRE